MSTKDLVRVRHFDTERRWAAGAAEACAVPFPSRRGPPLLPAKLTLHKNAEGKYHCPVTFKEFNEHTRIAAIRTSGHVYSYDAVHELNVKAKNWTDLMTGEPFTVRASWAVLRAVCGVQGLSASLPSHRPCLPLLFPSARISSPYRTLRARTPAT